MCLSGTDEYIAGVVARYSDMLLRLAMTRLSSPADAEDAVQEVYLRLLTAKPRFRDGEHEKAWLIRATLQRASDIRRRSGGRELPLEEAGQVEARSVGEGSDILSAVQALPQKYSEVIHLYYYEGYTIKEIARLLRLPGPTVGTRLARGREKLKQMLKEDIE